MKRLIILLLLVAALIGGAIASAPFIAATDLAKRRIATQIEEWTGRPVSFTGEPRVKLFPYLSLTIDNAKISDAEGSGDAPIVEMDHLTCKLRLVPFLLGRTEVAEFQLVRPRFRIAVEDDGRLNWLPGPGATADVGPASADEASRQIADIRVGRFKIIDGTIIYDEARGGRHEKLTDVMVTLTWPSVAEAVAGAGSFTWRNEPVEFNVSVSQPLNLIAGRSSPMRFAVASKPFRVSFTGTANGLMHPQLEGATTVTAPSVRRVAEWLDRPMGEGSILGAGLIEGQLNWIGKSLSFTEAHMELDGNSAEGALAINLDGPRPKAQGTLAFERLDLSAYIEALQASINSDGPWPLAPARVPLINAADADIRLSASQVLLGTVRLGKTAASALIDDGKLGINIGEAQFYGGSLTGRAELERSKGETTGSARIEIDRTLAGVALRDLAGFSLLDGAASVTLDATGSGETWGAVVEALAGSADFKVADGSLGGLELGQMAALAGEGGISDPAAGSGAIPFRTIAGKLALADGVIKASDIHTAGDGFAIDVAGQLSLADSALQARGVISAAKRDAVAGQPSEIPFVVSGSWLDPLLLPDFEHLIERGAEIRRLLPTNSASRPAQPNG